MKPERAAFDDLVAHNQHSANAAFPKQSNFRRGRQSKVSVLPRIDRGRGPGARHPFRSGGISYIASPLSVHGDIMRTFFLSATFCFTALLSQSASAQDASFYNCQNDRVRISIAPMRLDKALAKFTSITRCPVSIDTDRVKGRPTRNMKTRLTKGRMTPGQALTSMLRGTTLKSTPIHGGFSVSQ